MSFVQGNIVRPVISFLDVDKTGRLVDWRGRIPAQGWVVGVFAPGADNSEPYWDPNTSSTTFSTLGDAIYEVRVWDNETYDYQDGYYPESQLSLGSINSVPISALFPTAPGSDEYCANLVRQRS